MNKTGKEIIGNSGTVRGGTGPLSTALEAKPAADKTLTELSEDKINYFRLHRGNDLTMESVGE